MKTGDDINISIGGYPIGKLTSFTPSDLPTVQIKTLDVPEGGFKVIDFSKPKTITMAIKSLWLSPSLRPLPWHLRNPPIHVLRWWWIWHLGKTNRSFKRTRLAAIRRLWRLERFFQGTWEVEL